jgi:uncharacterized membrane protein YkoI
MTMRAPRWFRCFGLGAACALVSPLLCADDIKLHECPLAVRTTIERNLLGGKLDEIKEIRIADHTLYVVEIDLKGFREAKLYVAGDGTLRKTVQEIRFKDLPEPVRAALNRYTKKGKVEDVEMVYINGKVQYEVEIDQPKGPDRIITFDADGTVTDEK